MASTSWTSEAAFDTAYSRLFETFSSGRTKNVAWRKWQLKQCWWMIVDNESKMAEALKTDLNRNEFESYSIEIVTVKNEILETLKHVDEWAADETIDAGFIMGTLGKARLRKEPLGVAFIIGAWNFPFVLSLSPMLAAIAAGCCVMVKPSEVAAASQDLVVDMIRQYLDPQAVQVVTGGAKETTFMLKYRFDHIFYTGSTKVAGFITAAAARHLTPTVLELGGQSPGHYHQVSQRRPGGKASSMCQIPECGPDLLVCKPCVCRSINIPPICPTPCILEQPFLVQRSRSNGPPQRPKFQSLGQNSNLKHRHHLLRR